MYKVALVGLGGISNTHLPVWKELDDCELVAVCDTRPEQMDAYPDARHYTDFYEMLEKEKLDINLFIPNHFHSTVCNGTLLTICECGKFFFNLLRSFLKQCVNTFQIDNVVVKRPDTKKVDNPVILFVKHKPVVVEELLGCIACITQFH